MLSNIVTDFIVPHSNSSNTDILLSNITSESELESDNSISIQRGKDLKSLFKTIYTDFYTAGIIVGFGFHKAIPEENFPTVNTFHTLKNRELPIVFVKLDRYNYLLM